MNEKFKNQATVTIIISLVIIIIALIYKIKKDNAATRAFSIKEWSDYLRNSSIDEQMEAAKAMPIPLDAEVADRLIEKRRCYRFKDSNGNLGSIGCKDSRINLKEIIEYYKKLNGSALSCGIRIYPAYFKEKHEMSFIIACTNGDNNNIDQGYTILKDLFYNGSQHSFQLTDSITHSEAKKLVREYKDNVWIKEDSLP
ncbi:MAG TPA: hypothetical protein PLD02_03745, partial [Saprospiraceae bacterium]|nr:hypothetical protein [Saprospiraceae bacterium]